MSHFTVAVFIDGKQDSEYLENRLEEMLAPFQENNMGDCPEEYLEFHSSYKEHQEEYEHDGIQKIKFPDGTSISPWDEEELKKKIPFVVLQNEKDLEKYPKSRWYSSNCWINNKRCTICFDLFTAHAELVEIPFTDLYPKYEDFLTDYYEVPFDAEMQDYGYWENPNSKWDWWQIGGRWEDSLKLKSGERTDYARLKDIDFTPDSNAAEHYRKLWRSILTGVCEDGIEKYHFFGYPNAETLVKTYGTEEEFVRINTAFSTFAVITKDGEWIEKGQMGWWGCSSETPEEGYIWDREYKSRFIDDTDPNTYLVIVDCHI